LPWILAAAAYLVAFRNEGIGGGISLICLLIAFYPYDFFGNDIILVLLTVTPSVLFLTYWWMVFRLKQKNAL
jgi:hypothetical protein